MVHYVYKVILEASMMLSLYMLKYSAERLLRAIASQSTEALENLSLAELAEKAHMPLITVRRQVRNLARQGYISIERPCSNAPYSFRIEPKTREELNN